MSTIGLRSSSPCRDSAARVDVFVDHEMPGCHLRLLAQPGQQPVGLRALEGRGAQVFYQVEKDWHYRKEERRWVSMNDVSSWYRCVRRKGRVVKAKFHIR